jgi:hypothetical protein
MAMFPSKGGSRGSRSPAFSSKSASAGLKLTKPRIRPQHTKLASNARWQGLHHQPLHPGRHTGGHRPRWGWLTGMPAAGGGAAPASAMDGPITIDWQEPTSLDDAIRQPGAGVFIIENTAGDAPQPVQVGDAAEGFAQRLRSMQEDPSSAGAQQVRLGLISVRRGHRADRAMVRAVAHDIAARISASGAAGPGFPAQGPSPSEQRLLQQRPAHDNGAVPDYLAADG